MSFQTEMEARFGAENIKQWTNPGPNTNTTSVNTTVLAAALTDTEGDFRTIAGVEYDSTDNRMLKIACDRASCYLRMRGTSHGGWDKLWEKTTEQLKSLQKVTNANRLNPQLVDRSLSQNNELSKTMDRLGISRIKERSWSERL